MHIAKIQQRTAGDSCVIGAEINSEGAWHGPSSIWFRFPRSFLPDLAVPLGDAFVAATLPVAMACAEPLVVRAEVSKGLLNSLTKIQDLYHTWEPSMSKIEVIPESVGADNGPADESGVGLFFSLGVDSFYSLVRNMVSPTQAQITHLILVRGFDISLGSASDRLFENSVAAASRVAEEFGKVLVPVTTNIRQLADRFVPWGKIYHGAALASVGLATCGALRSVYMASTYDLNNLKPWGSHPVLDPLWSNGWTTFYHDACEVPRIEKIRLLSTNKMAMDSLRVCFENANSDYNCGKCDKCLLTMLPLQLVGGLQRCRTLPNQIDLSLFDHVRVDRSMATSPLWKENLAALQNSEGEVELKQAVIRYLDRARQDCSPQVPGTYSDWIELKRQVAREIERLSQSNEIFILAGEQNVARWIENADIRIHSFPEKDGVYWGTPADDGSAIEELEDTRNAGARFFVVDQDTLWWFDFFKGFRDHLYRNYQCVLSDNAMIVFDLHAPMV